METLKDWEKEGQFSEPACLSIQTVMMMIFDVDSSMLAMIVRMNSVSVNIIL